MAEISISYKLDLVIQLLDTTTGQTVGERQVLFYRDGQLLPMHLTSDGLYILMNHGRHDMKLLAKVKGYEPAEIFVCYDTLDSRYPIVEVPLIPIIRPYGYTDLCELSGTMEGIEELAAVSFNNVLAKVCAYNAKKNTLRLFSSSRLDEGAYAVLHEENMEYEEFRIIKKAERGLLLYLGEPMQSECIPEEGVARIVRGKVDVNGRYLLRVRKDGEGTRYLIRIKVNGDIQYKVHSFDEEERSTL